MIIELLAAYREFLVTAGKRGDFTLQAGDQELLMDQFSGHARWSAIVDCAPTPALRLASSNFARALITPAAADSELTV